MTRHRHSVLFCAIGALAIQAAPASTLTIEVDPQSPPANFAVDDMVAALATRGIHAVRRSPPDSKSAGQSTPDIVFAETGDTAAIARLIAAGGSAPAGLRREGFSLQCTQTDNRPAIWIVGADAGGVMYGGLELAEQVRLHGLDAIEPMTRNPSIAMRGAKFNIPLDLRTPSYSDMSDAAQANIAEVWNFSFWTEFIDRLARDRYNFISLWNLHPFPSLVRVPEFPDIALDDVQRSTATFDENYPTTATGLVTPAMLAHVETVRTLSIDEKIDFWRRVMRYAKDRNIDFYIVTWNIFTYGTGGKYGITDAIDNPTTRAYFRASVRELFKTYPLLRGIGVTTGENMGDASFEAKEQWVFDTYGQGVLDAARAEPGRRIGFIHRQHQTRAQDIARTFAPLIADPGIDFVFSFKYAQAHALSSTTQTFHREFVENLGGMKTLWTVRNDDALLFRWGAPDFVRAFIGNLPRDVTEGITYGSDMWIWGREFLSLDPDTPRQLEISKHWFDWMLWGRLAYDRSLDDDRIVAILGRHFPGAPARALFDAWQNASMIYPLTTGFHWGEYDFQWYIEGCCSRPGPAQTKTGFHDVNRFITLGPHPGTDNISIPRFVEASLAQKLPPGTSPPQVAARLHQHAAAALASIATIDPGANKELRETLADIRAMSLLGEYYSHKIAGATALAFYRATHDRTRQTTAIHELTSAAAIWRDYTQLAASRYKNPVWTNRVGIVDWNKLDRDVAHDIDIARE